MFEILRQLVTIALYFFTSIWALLATIALFAEQDGAFESAVVGLLWVISLSLREIADEKVEKKK